MWAHNSSGVVNGIGIGIGCDFNVDIDVLVNVNNLKNPTASHKRYRNLYVDQKKMLTKKRNLFNDHLTRQTMVPEAEAETGTEPEAETRIKEKNKYNSKTSYTGCRMMAEHKWKIILPVIILLLCQTSHVHAIRKGRLMTPSTFTALSGDLHVQIQFSSSDSGHQQQQQQQQQPEQQPNTTPMHADGTSEMGGIGKFFSGDGVTTTTSQIMPTSSRTGSSTNNKTMSAAATSSMDGIREVENVITSTLVISKYIDDTDIDGASLPEFATAPKAAKAAKATKPPNSTSIIARASGTAATESISFDEQQIVNTDTSSFANVVGDGDGGGDQGVLLHRRRKEIVQNIPVYPDPRNNVTQIAVPCQTFTRGGLYEMQIVTNLKTTTAITPHQNPHQNNSSSMVNEVTVPTVVQTTTTLVPVSDERLRQTLDVRWPSAEMRLKPERLLTYPDAPVEVELRFPEVNCERAWQSGDLPDFWLELIYCGKERSCTQMPPQNVSKSNILYAEQVRGYPKLKVLKLGCELFGLAGNYAVQLRPMIPAPGIPITRRFLSADWSDKFVFNVYARSIFPCDPHTGIGVLYEYPACILEQGDRVRLYAKLRADVASLKPPTTLHYVAEQRVVKSQYSLYFSCDLFTEKYVEYCFTYVSQAISGAVADVRMDCVPTLPVSESDTGGWGPWSEWTPCSTNCLGGTRNRYRFCDSPPPRYGAKFCEGSFVETEKCGQQNMADTWDCLYETSYGNANTLNNLHKANRTEVSQEIGPGCRCGCIVHLGAAKPKRYIAGATQSCPGRSFWLIQVDGVEVITLLLDFLRLPCPSQYIKVRDGPSLSSTLLVELNGGNELNAGTKRPAQARLESTGAQMLVEFFAAGIETQSSQVEMNTTFNLDPACTGGFLANVEQLVKNHSGTPTTLLASTRLSPNAIKSRSLAAKSHRIRNGFSLVHLSAVIFASIIIIISAMLGAQYVVRYRKYHLAVARRRDEGSRLHTPRASLSSLQCPPSRAMSTTTLLSEVICLVKMRPKHQLRHSILRESVDAENLALARETGFTDNNGAVVVGHLTLNKCAEELSSSESNVTLRNELMPQLPQEIGSLSHSPSEIDLTTPAVETLNSPCGTLTRKDSSKDTESIISSGMSSIYNSPPMNSKRLSKYSDRYDAVTLKIRNSHASAQHDSDSLRSSLQQLSIGRSTSASLTNGCYSPAISLVSTATIRTTNPKESKEKQNRKKLLARPGSEFSLGNQEELELDYYDYNVINAGAAPGSYLGMDPAYLIWIPPFEDCTTNIDGDKTPEPNMSINEEPDETVPLYEEIRMPKYGHYLSPGSNSESTATNTTNTNNTNTPTSDEISPLSSHIHSKVTTPCDNNYLKNSLLQQAITCGGTGPNNGATNKPSTPYMTRKQKRAAKKQSKSAHTLGYQDGTSIALTELCGTKSARNIAPHNMENASESSSFSEQPMNGSYVEKETEVVKSPSGDLQNFLTDIDDIEFADESESSDFYETTIAHNEKEREEKSINKPIKKEITRVKQRLSNDAHTREIHIRELEV